ncbi:MAG TPA: TonB family protein [Verrucomicrobiae bacterium]|nr:TonB family protein [Verrucomicrobiae bacterium]
MRYRYLAALVLANVFAPLTLGAVGAQPQSETIGLREQQFSRILKRASEFADVAHISSRPVCEDVHPPEALATPDPLLLPAGPVDTVRVSFIIGVDGRVHSPLILESAGLASDRRVLDAVRRWRYRPATCDGIPTETEGKVEFSSR